MTFSEATSLLSFGVAGRSHLESASNRGKSWQNRRKMLSVGILALFLVVPVGNTLMENHRSREVAAWVQATAARSTFKAMCFSIKEESEAMAAGDVGSSERKRAVDAFYFKVISSPCVVWGDDTILTNPFYGIKAGDSGIDSFRLAYRQALQGWNGVEYLGDPSCADGWNSHSIGKSGACSHHGGVTTKFQNEMKYKLGSALWREGMQTIYDPGSNEKLVEIVG